MVSADPQAELFEKVVEITKDHLGPASERFIARQIKSHLNKDPEQLKPQDIPSLAEWTVLAIGLLTDDQELIDSYTNELLKLTK